MVMILTGFLAYGIPDIPRSVRRHMSAQLHNLKEKKVQTLTENYRERRKKIKSDTPSFRQQCMALNRDFTE